MSTTCPEYSRDETIAGDDDDEASKYQPTQVVVEQSPRPSCEKKESSGTRQLFLTANATNSAPQVIVHPSHGMLTTTLTSNDSKIQWDVVNKRMINELSNNPNQSKAVDTDTIRTLMGSNLFSAQTLIMIDDAVRSQIQATKLKLTKYQQNAKSSHLTTLRSKKIAELSEAIANSTLNNVDGSNLILFSQHLKNAKKKGDMLPGGTYETKEMELLREKTTTNKTINKLKDQRIMYSKCLYDQAYSLAKNGIDPSSTVYHPLLQYLKDVSEFDTARQRDTKKKSTLLVDSRSEAELLVNKAQAYPSIAKGIKNKSSNAIGRILRNTDICESDQLEMIKLLNIFGNDNTNNDDSAAASKVFLFHCLSPGVGEQSDVTKQRLTNVSCLLLMIDNEMMPSHVHITEYNARGESGYKLCGADGFHCLLADIANTSPDCKIFLLIADELRGGRDIDNCRRFATLTRGLHPNVES